MNPPTSRRRSSTPPSSPHNDNNHHSNSLSSSTTKRPTLSSSSSTSYAASAADHYDIYCIPCTCPSLSFPQSTHYPSASFLIVHRASALQSGLGVRFGLASDATFGTTGVVSDPGFSLHRETGYEPDKAVLLGWVEQERLAFLEQVIRGVQVPRWGANEPTGREMLDWLLGVARALECEGVAANGELLLADVLDARIA